MVMNQEFFQRVLEKFIETSPPIFWAGIVFLAGLLFAKWMSHLSAGFLDKMRLNQILRRLGTEDALSKIDSRLNAPKFFGEIVRWFFIVLFMMACSEILGLHQLSNFFDKIINYFPNIFISALIFLVALFLADFSQKIVIGTLEEEKITYSRFLGRTIRWVIWLFAILAILYQLQITPSLILTVFIGMVATVSLALGIAFGLGGKDLAAKILKELEEKLK
jgi:small-conductance mechanosensitive channel